MDKPTLGALYQGYAKAADGDVDAMRALFQRRYGQPPVEIHDAGTIWLCGPIGAGGGQDTGAGVFDELVAVGDLDTMAEQLRLWG